MCSFPLSNIVCSKTSYIKNHLHTSSSLLCDIQCLRVNPGRQHDRLDAVGLDLLSGLNVDTHGVVVARSEDERGSPTEPSPFSGRASGSPYTSRN